eukprot:TRINITY_DN7019_c0_g1_i1.p1 TRINITY_DN7019_c0_g1~~TRINITY_DN7019_c0_g1_i1.p1  ORF type:complete len:142 (-),score=33.40 TRINITY_DN7019_c0_g1_i1:292-717(-)
MDMGDELKAELSRKALLERELEGLLASQSLSGLAANERILEDTFRDIEAQKKKASEVHQQQLTSLRAVHQQQKEEQELLVRRRNQLRDELAVLTQRHTLTLKEKTREMTAAVPTTTPASLLRTQRLFVLASLVCLLLILLL